MSIFVLGGCISSSFSGVMADKIGRKPTIIIMDILFIVSGIILFFATSFEMLYLGRLLSGLGIGVCMMVSNIFLAEQVPTEVKGQILPTYLFTLFAGIASSYLIGMVLEG
jgi:MFS family permease